MYICMCVCISCSFICLSISGYLDCFYILAIVNNAAVGMREQVSFQVNVFTFFRKIPRYGHMVVLFSCLPFLKYTFPLPPAPFLFSFLLPGDAVTALKATHEPRIRTEEEDGPETRPFAPGNLTIPTLFEACCESSPHWWLSGPHCS